uniref:Uncharacterized protein n=1 Tax=Dulem virus 268 TaxID=3145745 RepID=A0AAU8B5C6_9VIRU
MDALIEKSRLNGFQYVKIPRAKDLYDLVGSARNQSHPDNTDPYHFGDVVNPTDVDNIDILTAGKIVAEQELAKYNESQRQSEDPAPTPSDISENNLSD